MDLASTSRTLHHPNLKASSRFSGPTCFYTALPLPLSSLVSLPFTSALSKAMSCASCSGSLPRLSSQSALDQPFSFCYNAIPSTSSGRLRSLELVSSSPTTSSHRLSQTSSPTSSSSRYLSHPCTTSSFLQQRRAVSCASSSSDTLLLAFPLHAQ